MRVLVLCAKDSSRINLFLLSLTQPCGACSRSEFEFLIGNILRILVDKIQIWKVFSTYHKYLGHAFSWLCACKGDFSDRHGGSGPYAVLLVARSVHLCTQSASSLIVVRIDSSRLHISRAEGRQWGLLDQPSRISLAMAGGQAGLMGGL